MLTPRSAHYSDLFGIAVRMRNEDRCELRAASGKGPFSALETSFAHTINPMVGVDEDNQPVCIGGVVPFPDCPLRGAVWAVATKAIEKHRMSFLRRSVPWVASWQAQFPILTNTVDERNEVHIQWLRWLGFTFIARHPEFGVERRPFLEFVRIDPSASPCPSSGSLSAPRQVSPRSHRNSRPQTTKTGSMSRTA